MLISSGFGIREEALFCAKNQLDGGIVETMIRNRRTLSLLAAALLPLAAACWKPRGIGVGGHYLDGKTEIVRGKGKSNYDKAVADLEYVVSRDPLYRDSLTLLGRAYYGKERYRDAFQILKRALAVNSKDEIAWIALGLTQLRLGDDENGLESLKGGITLLSKATAKEEYKGIENWDLKGDVRTAIRRATLYVTKGLEAKTEIIRFSEILLQRVDDEEYSGNIEKKLNRRHAD